MKFKTSDKPALNQGIDTRLQDIPQNIRQPEVVHELKPKDQSRSIIGSNIKFRGELIGTEDLHIEGSVEGTVIMKGHNLSIGTQGLINANIYANNITIHGELTGDVLADELIAIKNSAVVKGNLIAPRIQLDDGGKFRGSMDMVDSEQEKQDAHSKFQEKLVHPHLPNKLKSSQSSKHAHEHIQKPLNTVNSDPKSDTK